MTKIARRGFLALGAASVVSLGLSGRVGAAVVAKPATFVLVHGAMHGGWCWKRVRPLLARAGAQVFAPTLTGLGERAHLLTAQVGLATHVQDVVNLLLWEELSNVVLVGHSYGGMVITGVADKIGERISKLVYLDGIVPRDGESAMQAMGLNNLAMPENRAVKAEAGTDFGIKDAEDLKWVMRRLTPQGVRTLNEPLKLTRDLSMMKRYYVACAADRDSGSDTDKMRKFALARIDKTWRTYEIATGHDAMITAPKKVAKVLLEIAG